MRRWSVVGIVPLVILAAGCGNSADKAAKAQGAREARLFIQCIAKVPTPSTKYCERISGLP